MEKRSDTLKTVLVVLLLVVFACIVWFQFARLTNKAEAPSQPTSPATTTPAQAPVEAPAETETLPASEPPSTAAQPQTDAVTEDETVEPAPAEEPEAEPSETPAARPGAQKQPENTTAKAGAAPGQPKTPTDIPFIDEDIDKSFHASGFFSVNQVVPAASPFKPPAQRVPTHKLGGAAQQLSEFGLPSGSETRWPGMDAGEVPLLPLPGETLGEPIVIRLIGVSQCGDSATALFTVGEGEDIVLAHPGWTIGADYVFVGAEDGHAKVFDRKANKTIQLATGETL